MATDPNKPQDDPNQKPRQGNPDEAAAPARKQPVRDTVTGEPTDDGSGKQGGDDGKQPA